VKGAIRLNFTVEFTEYLSKERNMSDNTVSGYITDLGQFFSKVKKQYSEIVMQDIVDFITWLRKMDMAVSTVNRKLASLKTYFKFLMRNGIISNNPASLIEGGKLEKKLPRPLDKGQINKIVNLTESVRNKAIIEALYGSGVRRSELVNIKKEDVNWDKGILLIHGKGSKDRLVPLNDRALELLKRYADSHNSEWIFPSSKNKGCHISTRRLNEIIEECGLKAGVAGVTPHKFRHSFGSHLFENGIDSRVLKDLMGHESINTTVQYAKVCTERNISEYKKFFKR
jgi:site-specific recombinase XerD